MHTIGEGIHTWEERDEAVAFVLELAPAPALPCRTWCELEPGHGWESFDDGRLLRWHGRDLLPLAAGVPGGTYATVSSPRPTSCS